MSYLAGRERTLPLRNSATTPDEFTAILLGGNCNCPEQDREAVSGETIVRPVIGSAHEILFIRLKTFETADISDDMFYVAYSQTQSNYDVMLNIPRPQLARYGFSFSAARPAQKENLLSIDFVVPASK